MPSGITPTPMTIRPINSPSHPNDRNVMAVPKNQVVTPKMYEDTIRPNAASDLVFFHIPNGRRTNTTTAKAIQKMGKRKV
jgi:hypothetical protein